MPCRHPRYSKPFQCDKKVARGKQAPDGNDHAWPAEGHLIVERCERFCWYCFEKKGKTKVWKHPWYLRRHVLDVHAGRTHPQLTCSEGWSESEKGNRKPWKEYGTAAPMGRRAKVSSESPGPEEASTKQPKTPDRKQKRKAQKMKRASTMTPPPPGFTSDTTPSPSGLSDESFIDTPASQLPLLTFASTSDGMIDDSHLGGSKNMTTSYGDTSLMALSKYPSAVFADSFGGDMFGDSGDVDGLSMSFGPSLDTTLAGLDYTAGGPSQTSSYTTTATNDLDFKVVVPASTQHQSSSINPTFPDTNTDLPTALPKTWTQEQVCRTNGVAIAAVAPKEGVASAADDFYDGINQAVLDRVVMGELTEAEALYVLQTYTESFQQGKR